MKNFMDEKYLLTSETAEKLYFEHAKKMPIFDYHNHLPAKDIYLRRRYDNLTQVWLEGDHYKWRAMRAQGISENYITGNGSDYEKFEKWAYTVERIPGNPLYAWTHLELQRYFNIAEPLTTANAKEIWEACNEKLKQPGFDSYGLLEKMNVKILCTTNEPFEDLEWHIKIKAEDAFKIKVLPTYRPDCLIHLESGNFGMYVAKMEEAWKITIHSLEDLKTAVSKSISYFKAAGCMLSDHGFEAFTYGRGQQAENAFLKAMQSEPLTREEIQDYKGEMLRFLAEEYIKNGFAMQLHLGALRNGNTKFFHKIGMNCGCDSVGEGTNPYLLSAYLDDLVTKDKLPKTILYCLNPVDNTLLSTMAVNYASEECKGKVQFGSAWWFLDHIRGIKNQIYELMETGLLAGSVGMLTDSRSFTSFGRHEYYRRILCSSLGELVENGEYPPNMEILGSMVENICYNNALHYFETIN